MKVHRYLYVTQEDLVVWQFARGSFAEVARFPSTEDGFQAFSAYLREDPQALSMMLVDAIEEEFFADTIPKLPMRDRSALIDRRLGRKYSRTRYRLGHVHGTSRDKPGSQDVLYSAVSNHELIDPWLAAMVAQSSPLVGIHSVPLLGPQLLSKVRKPAGNALLLSHHQGNRLRQVYLKDGKLKSARLSQAPGIDADDYGEYVFNEILRSRRYLERSRLLGGMEDLDVYMITDGETADRIIASDKGRLPLHFHFIRVEAAAKAVRLHGVPDTDRLEALYLAVAARDRVAHNYAQQGETRYFQLRRARRFAIGGIVAASLACSAVAGFNLMTGLELRGAITLMDSQIAQMEDTFRRENDGFAPLRADSHEMKLAVDTGDYILANRLPVSWVMQQLGAVLSDFPEIRIDELTWEAESAGDNDSPAAARRRGQGEQAVPVLPLQAVRAEIRGQVLPFEGDLRGAFATIDQLENSLRGRTDFEQVETTEYPLDASPRSSISGELVNRGSQQFAHFRMSLRLNVGASESDSESI